uniref:Immunoglobulin V-set domain-containing protein n=1 Tax=Catagonus wagneri TaxID=51154 RepID=A0A8C3X6R3_9CETA
MPRHLLALLLGPFLGVSAQTIHQWPASRVQLVGSALILECTVKGTSNPNLYRQTPEGALQLLFYSFEPQRVDSEKPQNLSASRPEDGCFTLSSKNLLLGDSGFYLCAWSLTLRRVGQTSVQKPPPSPTFLPPTRSRSPHSGDWLKSVFVTGFLIGSQREGN